MTGANLRRIAGLLALFTIGSTSMGISSDWPALPSKGFVTGRPAHIEDVNNGDAVFVAAVNGVVIGKALATLIPQYALLRNTRERVVVVQAEEANGIRMFGVRGLDGKEAVVTEADLELLGPQIPAK
jgi:hypothetical protein